MNTSKFLAENTYIDFSSAVILNKTAELFQNTDDDIEKARIAFTYVRDEIPHSFDVSPSVITAKASEVLLHKTGICHAKANLLAAFLRSQGIPVGFCFQRIRLGEDASFGFCVHCFNAIYVDHHWIKVDASGNTNGKNAQFSLGEPQLAFPNRNSDGEFFWEGIYAKPHKETMQMLEKAKTLRDVVKNIPDQIREKPDIVTLSVASVKQYGLDAGADVVGIASAKDFALAPVGYKPVDNLPQCASVIILGTTFPKEVLGDVGEYTASRNAMLSKMTDIANTVAKRIKADGHSVKAISSSGGKWVDNNGRKQNHGFISLKHAAEIAGLGVIGKNYLLTSPQYGNLIWLSAVLTDAQLTPDKKMDLSLCENCDECVKACPVRALDDITAFGRNDCAKHFVIENKKFKIKCYLCRTVCPHCFGF